MLELWMYLGFRQTRTTGERAAKIRTEGWRNPKMEEPWATLRSMGWIHSHIDNYLFRISDSWLDSKGTISVATLSE